MKTIHLPAAAQAAFQELGGFLKARPGRAKKRALQGVAIAIGVTTVLGAEEALPPSSWAPVLLLEALARSLLLVG